MVSPCRTDFSTSNVYQDVTAPFIDNKVAPPGKIAFLIQGFEISNPKYLRNSHLAEARALAELNNGLVFDCMHAFDKKHLFSFFRQFPDSLHKRLSLHIIRVFAGFHIDDTIENFLKPVFNWIYEGQPKWLNELSSESYPATFASIQAEMGGLEFMDAEYDLIKKSLLRTSKQVSADAFKEYLEDNPSVTEVYALIGLIHLNFLDRVIDNKSNQRHIIYNLGERQVTVHLFGEDNDDPKTYEDMCKFAEEKGLKVPTKKTDNDKSSLKRALQEFKEWREDSCHYAEADEELVEWLHDDKCAEKLIKTFEDFEQLVCLAKEHGFKVTSPTRKAYEKAIQIRIAKKLSTLQNTTVYHDRPLQERIAESKNISELWIKSTLEGNVDKKISCFKTLNTAMEIFYSIRRRRNKGTQLTPSASIPALEIQSLIHKMFKSRKRTLLGIFPDKSESKSGDLPAKELPGILKKYLEFITLAQQAVEKFDKREMPFFDPLVGEHACQIRAAMFAEILNKEGIDEHIKLVRKRLADHADQIRSFIAAPPVRSRYVVSFKAFLEENNAIFDASEEILIIISSFILSETKKVKFEPNIHGVPSRHERILAKDLSKEKGLVPNFANAIIDMAQKELSKLSVIYVQRIALQHLVSNEEKLGARLVFGNNVKEDERHRSMIPCYPTMQLIFKRMLINKIPLVLRIEQFIKNQIKPYGCINLIFGNDKNGGYTKVDNPSQVLQIGAVFIHAKSITDKEQPAKILEEKILSHPITKLILYALADHPPYGSDDKVISPENPECDLDRQLAHQLGTCRSNPSLFMLEHIYCDLLKV